MGRAVLEQGSIEVAYGLDHATEYFLSVYKPAMDDEPILDMHTGPGGFGKKVDLPTMLEHWQKYGVPEGHVQRAWKGQDVTGSSPRTVDPNSCIVCCKPTTMRCSKCKTVYACSDEHARQGWKKHKTKCRSPAQTSSSGPQRTPAASKYPIKKVKAILFPVNEASPRIVEVECEARPPDPEDPEYDPGFDNPVDGVRRHLSRQDITIMGRVTTTGTSWIPDESTGPVIDVFCGDSCLIDGSPLNQSIQNATSGQARHNWSGHLLVMKEQDEYGRSQRYVDVDQQTMVAAIVYFTNYQSYY